MKEYNSRPLKKNYDLGKYANLYRSAILGMIKEMRQGERDYTPTTLDFGAVKFRIARHFGFCKGVENAIEMAYQALNLNVGKKVYMVSELIHNPYINEDLAGRGLQFIKTSTGKQLIPWENLHADDVVVIPAFGATVQDKALLQAKGIDIKRWDAMCRFVEHVWFRSEELGKKGFSIIIHGKFKHEETQATFSYSSGFAPTIVVKDMKESHILGEIIAGSRPISDFETYFRATVSEGFDPMLHLQKVAVVNQTTMLASETADIAQYFRQVMLAKYGLENEALHVGNTRDTLCYATKNNQTSTLHLLEVPADFAIVIGGRNSSNTSHLVELCEEKLPTYFIQSEADILSEKEILHFDFHHQSEQIIQDFLPQKAGLEIILTSGASCPDALLEKVIMKILSFYENTRTLEEVLADFSQSQN